MFWQTPQLWQERRVADLGEAHHGQAAPSFQSRRAPPGGLVAAKHQPAGKGGAGRGH